MLRQNRYLMKPAREEKYEEQNTYM